jgi:hypothetical protein
MKTTFVLLVVCLVTTIGSMAYAQVQQAESWRTQKMRLYDSKFPKKLDAHGNIEGNTSNLGAGQRLPGKVSILILCNGRDAIEAKDSPIAKALANIIDVELLDGLPALDDFKKEIYDSSQLWIWAGNEKGCLPPSYSEAILERFRVGKLALMLLADNAPYLQGVNDLLTELTGCTLEGDYVGDQIISGSESGPGFESGHAIFQAIGNLYEGITVSHIASTTKADNLEVVARNSEGLPLIGVMKPQVNQGRMVVTCGFTSLFRRYFEKSAGAERFCLNVCAFLAGVDK